MASTEPRVTDSWTAYQECTRAVRRFLDETRVKDGEVWIGDVCVGTPDCPSVRAPLRADSAALVHDALGRAEALVAAVMESLRRSVEVSRHAMDELKGRGAVDSADMAAVVARTESVEQLLAELTRAATLAPRPYHPAVLTRWRQVLEPSLIPGDPAVPVKVVTVYVL